MILRVSFKPGEVSFAGNSTVWRQLINVLSQDPDRPIILSKGKYDLTPSWWSKNTHLHWLEVVSETEADYWLIPKYTDSAFGLFEQGIEPVAIPGGTVKKMPQDEIIISLGGQNPNKSPGLFELIVCFPEPIKQKQIIPLLKLLIVRVF